MQRLLTTLLTIAVIAAAVCFVAAPFYGFFALRAAAQAQDVQALADLVDYDAVRASLRPQVAGTAAADTPPPSVWQDPIGALKHAVEPLQPAPKVETYLTPNAMAALTRGDGRFAPQAGKSEEGPTSGPIPAVRYWGVNRTRLAVPSSREGWGETVFTFERKGVFKWKLAHIGLPEKLPAQPVTAEPVPAN
jgi:hypothetical protein